ncbi:MAG: hypothetical protein ABI625_07505 [bacterium]
MGGTSSTNITNVTANWCVTANQGMAGKKRQIPNAVPNGMSPTGNSAHTGGTSSTSHKLLGTVAVDLLASASALAEGSRGPSYTYDASATAGVVASVRLIPLPKVPRFLNRRPKSRTAQ